MIVDNRLRYSIPGDAVLVYSSPELDVYEGGSTVRAPLCLAVESGVIDFPGRCVRHPGHPGHHRSVAHGHLPPHSWSDS